VENDFDTLIKTLRARGQRRVEQRMERRQRVRQQHAEVMAKALRLQAEGRIGASDVCRLHALRLRLDAGLGDDQP
jgi:hypothetical protein